MKSGILHFLIITALYVVSCSIIVSILCAVDLLQRNYEFTKGNMSLEELIEREEEVEELFEIETSIKKEENKLRGYVNNRFSRIQDLEGDIYSDELKQMFLHIKQLPRHFRRTLSDETRRILKTRSGLQLEEELKTLKNVVPMLSTHFQIYEIGKEINQMEAAAEVENKALENKIRKIIGEIERKYSKLHEIRDKTSVISEPCNPKCTPNCKEKNEAQDTLKSIESYLKQANGSFEVLQQSDLHFEKRPILIELYNHVQNIDTNTARYWELIEKEINCRS